MRKMLTSQKHSEPKINGSKNPYDEEDVGKRFAMLKSQMNVEDHDSFQEIGDSMLSNIDVPANPLGSAGPASGGSILTKQKGKGSQSTKILGPINKSTIQLYAKHGMPVKSASKYQINMTKSIDE